MILTSKAFILSYLKYGDSSYILKCYTKEFGFKSFILKNSFSKKQKKNHLLLLLNEIDISFYQKKNNSLELIKDIYQGFIFTNIHTDIYKSSIITFVSEVLNYTLKNENIPDAQLYQFISQSLTTLDKKEKQYADFHLYFLKEFSKYIGFYPLNINQEFAYFNLREGVFSNKRDTLTKEQNAFLWNTLLAYEFNNLSDNCFNASQRSQMLEEILTYYETHLTNFKRPLSLDVLKVVFS
ncbi:recombination protein O N-terminal domain-containing protein [Apibacter raozihei]|uniref:DNA repair protein RecO n=1 Tax=Apibacter raozihei TaxID=2500547 RepID=UPI000FE406D8|nr:recombination protein O N-terminal domain-containing protein [Apibacter raozihei]